MSSELDVSEFDFYRKDRKKTEKMIFDLPNVKFTDEEWIYILKVVLKGWTEIPLNPNYGYNKDDLKFYDGIVGLLLKQTEYFQKEYPESLDQKFVNSWKYQGKLFRVLHPCTIEDEKSTDDPSMELPEVEYHEMITHWTTDFTFESLMYKLNKKEKYIILEADTKDKLAFDVNLFRKLYGVPEIYTQKEKEIIFPMYRKYITEYHMSINDFIDMKTK